MAVFRRLQQSRHTSQLYSTCSPPSVRKHDFAFHHEDEFVLVSVPVAHRRFLPWRQRGPIHADLRQPELLTELPLLPRHPPPGIDTGSG